MLIMPPNARALGRLDARAHAVCVHIYPPQHVHTTWIHLLLVGCFVVRVLAVKERKGARNPLCSTTTHSSSRTRAATQEHGYLCSRCSYSLGNITTVGPHMGCSNSTETQVPRVVKLATSVWRVLCTAAAHYTRNHRVQYLPLLENMLDVLPLRLVFIDGTRNFPKEGMRSMHKWRPNGCLPPQNRNATLS